MFEVKPGDNGNEKDPTSALNTLLETAEAMKKQLDEMGKILQNRDRQIAIAIGFLIDIGSSGEWRSERLAREAIDRMRSAQKDVDTPKDKSDND